MYKYQSLSAFHAANIGYFPHKVSIKAYEDNVRDNSPAFSQAFNKDRPCVARATQAL